MERELEHGAMAEAASASATVTETVDGTQPTDTENRSITIRLRKRKTNKKVEWSSDTVDNEHLGRRSSKCCCIYEKPRAFGESSSESEDEDGGCGNAHCVRGHHKKPYPDGRADPSHSPEHPEHRHGSPPEN
ncbi:E3 ubiquitin-protein ligase PPP1R11 [Pristis pectinata]|uniref:E3 ubiquitin-protein ligase PPP1R11 n=1 Tax=Pristis pectinata TaxID=685728 RepID=UPI00223E7F94|nr:E3 ubiquitin-protein ligase PPP1R11 [Pristis pectinata]